MTGAVQVAEAKTPAPESPSVDAERRQLTVMFCDLLDSTRLSERLDPEEFQRVLHEYHSVCSAVIRRFEGYIAQYLGDGIVVYFGYPRAHEDDAQRAVRAGLGIVEAIAGMNTRLQQDLGGQLGVRLGVHTGLVVVGEMGEENKREQLAMGETPNLAARVQSEAEPGTVVITAATYRLIEGFFDCRELGAHSLKGISRPVGLYQVLHESTARSRLEVVGTTRLTPLVGREQEMGLLVDRWEQIKEGVGQVVLLSGEAGIGKSRLLQALKEHISQDPQAWLTSSRCSPYHQNSAFYPIIDLLERVVLEFGRGDSPPERLGKLEGFLVQYGLPLAETLPLFASLLSLPLPDRYSLLTLTPEARKQKTVQALLTMFLRRAAKQPLLFVVEDLHWVDPSTLELLNLIVDQGPTTRALVVFTCRPEFKSPWTGRSHLTQVTLNRLTRRQVADMISRVARGKTLPMQVVQQIVSKTDGVPLFVEELTKMVLESGLLHEREDSYELTGPLPTLAIPATLHDSLMARLDRLATVKEVAQLGATLGREFTYELLKAVSPLEEAALQKELSQLVEAELLYQRGMPPQATFIFKHVLIQEAAYQSLLKSRRQLYHQKIAQVLEKQFPETAKTEPELLAYHFSEANNREQAIPYWLKAGERGIERSAHLEAIGHLTKGLELLRSLPETPERIQQEITLQIALGVPLAATRGYSTPEVEQAYARARELCQRIGETDRLFSALYGLWRFYLLRAEYATARNLGEQLLTLTQRADNVMFLVEAHRSLCSTFFYLGEFSKSRSHFEKVMTYEASPERRSQALTYDVVDPWVACRSYTAWTLWLLGRPDQARKESEDAIAIARSIGHPFSLALSLSFASWLHQFCGDQGRTRDLIDEALALSTEHSFGFWLGWGTVIKGWTRGEGGEGEEAIAQMRKGLVDWRSTGSRLGQSYFLSLLSEVLGKRGQTEAALGTLREAQEFADESQERWWQPELYRLKGKLILDHTRERHEDAEACFRQALDLAHRQGSLSLELRAAMSLSRLARGKGESETARRIVGDLCERFTEGFDTADMTEARRLLAELA